MRIPDRFTCLLKNLCVQVKKQQLELEMEQTGNLGTQLGKGVYDKAV